MLVHFHFFLHPLRKCTLLYFLCAGDLYLVWFLLSNYSSRRKFFIHASSVNQKWNRCRGFLLLLLLPVMMMLWWIVTVSFLECFSLVTKTLSFSSNKGNSFSRNARKIHQQLFFVEFHTNETSKKIRNERVEGREH